jgi:hypothetical protein
MAKFKRVAESQEMPDYIENQIAPQENAEQDLYAHLKASSRKNREVVARETLGEVSEDIGPKDWERLTKAAIYSQPKMGEGSEMNNLFASSSNTIRRAGYDVDEGENFRPGIYGDIKLQSDTDFMALAMRGETIASDNQEEIEKYFIQSQKTGSQAAIFETQVDRERKADAKHAQWQANQLRPTRKVLSRANAVVRNSMENLVDSKFGMPDYQAMEDAERSRLSMMDAKRVREQSIQRQGMAPEDKHELWENEENTRARTLQQHKASWIDEADLGEIKFE